MNNNDSQAVEVDKELGLGAPSIRSAIEALVLLQDDGITAIDIAQHTGSATEEIETQLKDLRAEYLKDSRGFELREVNGRWRLYSAASCSDLIERYVKDGQNARLTQASLESLSVIAYRQPTTRARVAAIRGVNVDGVIRTLIARGLVRESGLENGSGALLLHTTDLFIERLGIDSLEDLPSIEQFLPDIASIEALTDLAGDLE